MVKGVIRAGKLEVRTLVRPRTQLDSGALRMFRLRQFPTQRLRARLWSSDKEPALDAGGLVHVRAGDDTRFSFTTTFFLARRFYGCDCSILIGG